MFEPIRACFASGPSNENGIRRNPLKSISTIAAAALGIITFLSQSSQAEAGPLTMAGCMAICLASTAGAFAPACVAACTAFLAAPAP